MMKEQKQSKNMIVPLIDTGRKLNVLRLSEDALDIL